MDEKKVRKAIQMLRIEKKECKKLLDFHGNKQWNSGILRRKIENCNTAIEALEKQLAKKPIIKKEKEVPHTHNLGRLLRFHCPNCGKFIVAIYESDTERGGGISNSLKGCSTCLQSIDFSEYYTRECVGGDKLNENIECNN